MLVDDRLLRRIGRRILESAPRLQRVVAPFKHRYQKEYSISKVAANYWDYTHDWNCGILLFPNGWEFRISLLSNADIIDDYVGITFII